MDCDKHVRSLEQASMIAKAVRGYAARLEGQFAGVPQCEEIKSVQAGKLSLLLKRQLPFRCIDGLGPKVKPGRQDQIL